MQDVSVNYVRNASIHMNKKERKWNDVKREKVFTQDYVSSNGIFVMYCMQHGNKKCKSRLTSDRTRNKTYEERSDDKNIQIKSNRLSGLFIGIKAWQL